LYRQACLQPSQGFSASRLSSYLLGSYGGGFAALRRITRRSAIRLLETTHRDSFARSVGDERQSSQEQATLQNPIEATDRHIDALVYELYGLTEEEIEIVEDATG
jgi:hypothetical protein